MSEQPPQQGSLGAELRERMLDPDRLALDQEGAELIGADDIERGLQLANWIWFAVHGPEVFGLRDEGK